MNAIFLHPALSIVFNFFYGWFLEGCAASFCFPIYVLDPDIFQGESFCFTVLLSQIPIHTVFAEILLLSFFGYVRIHAASAVWAKHGTFMNPRLSIFCFGLSFVDRRDFSLKDHVFQRHFLNGFHSCRIQTVLNFK